MKDNNRVLMRNKMDLKKEQNIKSNKAAGHYTSERNCVRVNPEPKKPTSKKSSDQALKQLNKQPKKVHPQISNLETRNQPR